RGKTATVHIKIDTGMHRLGAAPESAIKLIKNIYKYKNIYLEGIFSHFADADGKDLGFAREQLEEFIRIMGKIGKIRGLLKHVANSDAVFRLPESHLDMVRPGKALYKNVLSLKTQIVGIRRLKKGESVGYGREFIAKKNILAAAIPVGYADGFRRSPKNWGEVVVNGRRAPVLGRVSMDQASIMVSKREKVGDEVILIGEGIPAEKVAKTLGTIPLEVLTGISGRVERIYNR
ncbi:MAG: alanine racemase, partial [Patescibacteria group bacterium]